MSTVSELRIQASEALRRGDRNAAIKAANEMIRDHGDNVQAIAASADVYLRAGKPSEAVEQFDRFIEQEPDQMPYLWQRGIGLFFIGEYDKAADQFAKHRVVNPNDVENAAWHFLCIAKAQTPEKAKAMVLPAPGDRREPMDEVLAMLSTGDVASVQSRMDAVAKLSPGSRDAEDARFYGELYLGLYADAVGNKDKAIKHLRAAAKDAPRDYMGDVARVYAESL
ncbi:lipoprotein NlpI [Rubripirellula tenax]|uniref:Lipoprotein NlpI n=1 Tax=Rubripirellula tenax TaxID=2528015 RepID=A0A5C6EFC4_9BACT|nr:tetratricopeptide repeat protein [Rubripirellula tenax]TWU47280.1 lipoprotein NlpI [Rubripirellula tenax]